MPTVINRCDVRHHLHLNRVGGTTRTHLATGASTHTFFDSLHGINVLAPASCTWTDQFSPGMPYMLVPHYAPCYGTRRERRGDVWQGYAEMRYLYHRGEQVAAPMRDLCKLHLYARNSDPAYVAPSHTSRRDYIFETRYRRQIARSAHRHGLQVYGF